MAKSLILVLTPYELEVLKDSIVRDLSLDTKVYPCLVKERRALERVKDKVEQMLSETSKARS